MGSLASRSVIPIMVVYCLLCIHVEKYSIRIKQQRQKYKHRDTKIELWTCHRAVSAPNIKQHAQRC